MTPDSLHRDGSRSTPGGGVTTLVRPLAGAPAGPTPNGTGVLARQVGPADARRGATVDFYRRVIPAGHALQDATNGGISARFHQAVVVGVLDSGTDDPVLRPLPENARRVAPSPHAPAVWLHRCIVGRPVWSLIPAMPDDTELLLRGACADAALVALRYWASRWMAGGNYASLGGTGLAELVEFYGAVAVHDREER
jgi:hypothetical protein